VAIDKAVLLSPEPWDEVWRRNQYLATELVRTRRIAEFVFVEPALPGAGRRFEPIQGICVLRPPLLVPRRAGGLRIVAAALNSGAIRAADLIWINDAELGVHCLRRRIPAVYDVTDDWREAHLPARARRNLIKAEDILSERTQVIVCSDALQERWSRRYSVTPPVVQNGVDRDAYQRACVRDLPGRTPHVGYVGTLHTERLDLQLVIDIARDPRVGTVHLVGPDSLTEAERRQLSTERSIRLHGPVPGSQVPEWLLSLDVLVCPHRVTPFTLSLDGIKAHEYLASGKPVVATPTSGFERLAGVEGVDVVAADEFVEAVARARPTGIAPGSRGASWDERAAEFAEVLEQVVTGTRSEGGT
jgi:teichuronic acid biosynthesis glycosyltransferase TuaH